MRKFKRIHSRQFGICLLAFTLVISIGGINKIRNAEAEENIPERIIEYQITEKNTTIPSRSIYIESEDTLNIVPKYQEPVRPDYDINLETKYQDLIWNLCLKNDISYELVLAVFHYESRFNPRAKNRNTDGTYDRGFCQLNSEFLSDYIKHGIQYCDLPKNVEFNVWNINHSIRAGIGHLVYLRNEYKANGVSEKELFLSVCNGWNMGMNGYRDYIKDTGKTKREFDYEVEIRKSKLESTHTL